MDHEEAEIAQGVVSGAGEPAHAPQDTSTGWSWASPGHLIAWAQVLTETAADGIITIDGSNTIVFANAAAGRIFGYTREELTGTDITRLMPEHLRSRHREGLSRYIETGERRLNWHAVLFAGLHRDGHEIPLEISFGEYRQSAHPLFVAIIRDVSERKALEEKLRQTAKLESLGVLAGGIAHDFNNLLTGVLGNVSLALEQLGENHQTAPSLRGAVAAAERAANLTRQLLAYAGKGQLAVERTDVCALVREMSALVQTSIPKHVRLRLDLEEGAAYVQADVAQLQQLIMNLVINGAEAIPSDREGVVLVLIRSQHLGTKNLEALGAGELPAGAYVMVSVHDNGSGMDESTAGRIFDPFFTTKLTGRGLGLAAVLGIVRGHRGALKVFSTPGEGTTFKVLLPANAGAQAGPGTRAVEPGGAVPGWVLVVDDEPVVRKVAATTLERNGYSVITAENGRQGVERFREWNHNLTAVVLDMTMPVMSGEEALEQMRGINPHVPVILSTGYSEAEATQRFRGKGLAGFLQKPYTAAALAGKIRAIEGRAPRSATPSEFPRLTP
ncbi:MAG TPA: PAS domain S-box protein [Bryobacteraceae bacterium]|nr:PAS domain S-box protein [Bryobacteraceae bacterium]